MIRDVLNHLGDKIGELELPDCTPEEVWQQKLSIYNKAPSVSSDTEKAMEKYLSRAKVKDRLIAEIAVENVQRIKDGTWQVSDLISLTQDSGIKAVLDDMNSLSFELALGKIDSISSPLITTEIKNQWKAKLAGSLFN